MQDFLVALGVAAALYYVWRRIAGALGNKQHCCGCEGCADKHNCGGVEGVRASQTLPTTKTPPAGRSGEKEEGNRIG